MVYLAAGTYQVNVTDANKCVITETVEISEPEAFCKNGGNCTGLFTCDCPSGWNGTDCSIRMFYYCYLLLIIKLLTL